MMKKTMCLIILIYLSNILMAQSKMYLISAFPNQDDEYIHFYTILYSFDFNSNKLQVIDTLNKDQGSVTRLLKVYHNQNKIVIYEDSKTEENKSRIMFMDINQFIKGDINFFNLDKDLYSSDHFNLIKDVNGKYYYILQRKSKFEYMGIDEDYTIHKVVPHDFCNVVLIGSPGAPVTGIDYMLLYSSDGNGYMYIPKTLEINKRPVFPITLPDSLQIGKKERLVSYINNDKVFVLNLFETQNSKTSQLGYISFLVYNKSNGSWKRLRIKGNRTRLTLFGNWLSGAVCETKSQVPSIGSENRNTNSCFNMPFWEVLKNSMHGGCIGVPFDIMSQYRMNMYFPGILYIFNFETDTYIEWNTRQGDSEILMIEDEVIYYRINNIIYKRSILEGSKLGSPIKLIESDFIPFIHWALIK